MTLRTNESLVFWIDRNRSARKGGVTCPEDQPFIRRSPFVSPPYDFSVAQSASIRLGTPTEKPGRWDAAAAPQVNVGS